MHLRYIEKFADKMGYGLREFDGNWMFIKTRNTRKDVKNYSRTKVTYAEITDEVDSLIYDYYTLKGEVDLDLIEIMLYWQVLPSRWANEY